MKMHVATAKGDFEADLSVARIEVGGPDGVVLFLESDMAVRLGSSREDGVVSLTMAGP
ncbi:hypothetical protein Apau_1657 [Aminomonas paucivorans DSM 12260]|uniref:Uncharacterized protein n=1 Tax=Aminomonas paucivorans DSM 12260 TaxID=584708 RepID=E3CUV0_9BACT|nr:hypothetical protein [Aminomonas paucivorans]EFQ24076.1 hypothetical protein Apau_1657 [Aminomonas paucivorans DSM 12260]